MGVSRKEYIVYDTVTDLPVCIGTVYECAETLKVTVGALKSAATKYFNGSRPNCRYIMYDLAKVVEGGYLEDGENYD